MLGTSSYVVWKGDDTKLADTVYTMNAFGLVSVLGTYVFGATWDDKNVMETLTRKLDDDTPDKL